MVLVSESEAILDMNSFISSFLRIGCHRATKKLSAASSLPNAANFMLILVRLGA